MKFVLTSNTAWSIYNFRKELILRLLREKHQVFILAPKDEYVEYLVQMGCIFLPLQMQNKGRNPFSDIFLWLQYYKYYGRLRPDFVINYTIKPVIYSSLACRCIKLTYLNVITGLGMAFSSGGLVHQFICFLYRRANASAQKVFFLNENDYQVFIDRALVDHVKAVVIPGEGVDCQYFAPREKEFSSEKVEFLFLGRILREKGVELLYQAFVRLYEKYPQARLRFMGFLNVPSDTAIKQEEMLQWCTHPGVSYEEPQEDVREFIAQVDCVVLPSFYNEGVPRSLLEAGAMAKVLITTDQVGCRDVVQHQKNGFLCEANNVESLEMQMEAFLKLSLKERLDMQSYSRGFVEGNFRVESVLELYWNEFSQWDRENVN